MGRGNVFTSSLMRVCTGRAGRSQPGQSTTSTRIIASEQGVHYVGFTRHNINTLSKRSLGKDAQESGVALWMRRAGDGTEGRGSIQGTDKGT